MVPISIWVTLFPGRRLHYRQLGWAGYLVVEILEEPNHECVRVKVVETVGSVGSFVNPGSEGFFAYPEQLYTLDGNAAAS